MVKKWGLVPLYAFVAALFLSVACSSGGSSTAYKVNRSVGLASESDSLAYIIGMSVAEQLMRLDSTINVDVVCRAIVEHSEGKAVIEMEDAQTAYLRYMLYVEPERRRSYEEQFLADMVAADRSYKRTKTGLTYRIEVIGDEKKMPKFANDWITIRYTLSRVDGSPVTPEIEDVEAVIDTVAVDTIALDSVELDVTDVVVEAEADIISTESLVVEESFVMNELPKGVFEAMRLIGKGGKIDFWVPSKLGYGEEGDAELGVHPIETLHYQVEILDVETNVGADRRQEQLNQKF